MEFNNENFDMKLKQANGLNLTSSLPSVPTTTQSAAAAAASGDASDALHCKWHSLPQLDCDQRRPQQGQESVGVAGSQLLFHLLLQKSRSPCPVKATLSKEQLYTAAEDIVQHLSYLVLAG